MPVCKQHGMSITDLLQQSARRLDAQRLDARRLDARRLGARRLESECFDANLDVRLLLQKAAGLSREELLLAPDRALPISVLDVFESYLTRRLQGEPVSRILGQRGFWGLDFVIGDDVFDPRPESEALVEAALQRMGDKPAQILDLGAGSGCLLLSIVHSSPKKRGVGIDILPEAVRFARYNARRLALSDRAHFLVGDWAVDYMGAFDLVISNPPYIQESMIAQLAPEVRLHDPVSALNGGADGLSAYRRIAALAPSLLAPGGQLLVEAGADQAETISEIFTLAGMKVHDIINDLSGHQRVVVAS